MRPIQYEVLRRIVAWAGKEETMGAHPEDTFPSRSVERRVTAQREARRTPEDYLRRVAKRETMAMLDAKWRTFSADLTVVQARDLVAALTDGVQEALTEWLPPGHPDRDTVKAYGENL